MPHAAVHVSQALCDQACAPALVYRFLVAVQHVSNLLKETETLLGDFDETPQLSSQTLAHEFYAPFLEFIQERGMQTDGPVISNLLALVRNIARAFLATHNDGGPDLLLPLFIPSRHTMYRSATDEAAKQSLLHFFRQALHFATSLDEGVIACLVSCALKGGRICFWPSAQVV